MFFKLFFCFLFLLFSKTVLCEGQSLRYGEYIARVFPDGSGSLALKYDPEIESSCKSASCEFKRKGMTKEKTFDDRWSFSIKQDLITDQTLITANRHPYKITEMFGEISIESNVFLLIDFSNYKNEFVCIAGHDYPGKRGVMRIGKNKPINTSESGCISLSGEVESQLRSSDKITIRGYHWPFDSHETRLIDLGGYEELSNFLRSYR